MAAQAHLEKPPEKLNRTHNAQLPRLDCFRQELTELQQEKSAHTVRGCVKINPRALILLDIFNAGCDRKPSVYTDEV